MQLMLLVNLTFIYDIRQEFMNLTEIDTLKICLLPAHDSASDLKLSMAYHWDVLPKLRRIVVLVVVVILFRSHASYKLQEAIS